MPPAPASRCEKGIAFLCREVSSGSLIVAARLKVNDVKNAPRTICRHANDTLLLLRPHFEQHAAWVRMVVSASQFLRGLVLIFIFVGLRLGTVAAIQDRAVLCERFLVKRRHFFLRVVRLHLQSD